ncbi:MAG: 4-hydroxythreonine-4-phosphate dehydrogenase PdxA [Bacteroidetes bacterium]|nr:MAG: 4-hydroxythreonine-4-phosphate dehydrogenase PdxA [Bacteroidota bacterium]PTM12828.1 MAG: 4-hydroxythreonine-4-phosphate dehydrogenase PdxA [Bacteroidota bacterium]
MRKPKIGISIGDINGIGPEVIIKTLRDERLLDQCTPIIYGSSKVISYHKNIVDPNFHFFSCRDAEQASSDKVNVINCWQDTVNIEMGKATAESGQYAAIALELAVNDLKDGHIDALVTAPINKHAMQLAGGFPFPGHTEYITQRLEAKQSLMFMVSDTLRVGLVTNHVPLSEVAHQVTKQLVSDKLHILESTLKMDFGLERPTIAVLGLNPHAGDGGLLGEAEEKIIRPAIVEAKKKGMLVVGPFPADGFFGSEQYRKFDGILAMYHDQGLIPFKLLSFGQGVNYTAGLSAIRTSPDHGTAYDLVGKDEANPASFRQALYQAIDIFRSRHDYLEMHANPLVIKEKRQMTDGEEEDEILPEDA